MNVELTGLRVLLLQGPNGPFFARLADELILAGAVVKKVHLNAAEEFYFGSRSAVRFRGTFSQWPDYLHSLLGGHQFDCCMYFGDQRPYHRAARDVLQRHRLPYFVFEDGYLRPDYVTVEEGGVNYRSPLRTIEKSAAQIASELQTGQGLDVPPIERVQGAFAWSVLHTIVNSIGVTLFRPLYPGYQHHRDVNTGRQALLWGRSGLRKAYFAVSERKIGELLTGAYRGRYFLVGLQVFNDSQVQASRFSDVKDFIDEVLDSFAQAAPVHVRLVVKHHPADRAYRDYGRYISARARSLGIDDRVHYVHDLHLPSLLEGARGTVVINSTVGWSSLHHGTPVYALCESTYGYLDLAAGGTLAEFWTNPPRVDRLLVSEIQRWLRATSQANGSVWVALPGAGPTGFRWPAHFETRLRQLCRDAPGLL